MGTSALHYGRLIFSGYTAVMTKFRDSFRLIVASALLPVMLVQQGLAWGREGHMMINRLAGAALPSDVPEFLRSKQGLDALEYYGPEPDRWKSPLGPQMNAAGSQEHYIELEDRKRR